MGVCLGVCVWDYATRYIYMPIYFSVYIYIDIYIDSWRYLQSKQSTAAAGQGRNGSGPSRTLKLLQLHRLRSDIDIQIDDRATIVLIIVFLVQAALIAIGATVQ